MCMCGGGLYTHECGCMRDWVRSQMCAGVDTCTGKGVYMYLCECTGSARVYACGRAYMCVCECVGGEIWL